MDRRRFLAGPTAALSLPLGGCVARSPGDATPETASGADGDRAGTEPGNASDDDASGTPASRGPVRGESDADVSATEVEDDEEVEYVPEDDAVRYVAAWRNTNPTEMKEGEPPEREPVYETIPFERWGTTNCITAAARAAAEHASDELGVDSVGHGISATVAGHDRAAVVSISTILDRDGEVVSDTSVEFDALVAATPATVDATYRLTDRKYSLEAPIFVRYDVMQQA